MDDKIVRLVQQRASIFFFSQYIGYSEENAKKFIDLIGHENMKIGAIQGQGIAVPLSNPDMPQLGMPWRIIDGNASINFLPGKIDVIRDNEEAPETGTSDFVAYVKDIIGKIINGTHYSMSRVAYAPLFSVITQEQGEVKKRWGKLLVKTSCEGIDFQNIELRYLLKKEVNLNGKSVQINLFHQISDGMHFKDGKKDADCLLLQIDVNTIPEMNYSFSIKDFDTFMEIAPKEVKLLSTSVLS